MLLLNVKQYLSLSFFFEDSYLLEMKVKNKEMNECSFSPDQNK